MYQTPPCRIRLFPHLLLHIPFLLVNFTSSHLCVLLSIALQQGASVHLPPPPDYWYTCLLFPLSGRSRSPTRNRSFSVFACTKLLHVILVYFPDLLLYIPFLLVHFTFSHLCVLLSIALQQGTSVHIPPLPDYWYTCLLFPLSGRSRSPTRNRSFSVFA